MGDPTFGLPLFGATYPNAPGFARDSQTSRAAAEAIAPKMRELHRLILAALANHGALTADEIADRLSRHVLTIRPRLTELKELGYVESARITRPSAIGNSMRVMRLTQLGLNAVKNGADVHHGGEDVRNTRAAPNENCEMIS
jgi:DNA-binding MarR family transcriptional regulator